MRKIFNTGKTFGMFLLTAALVFTAACTTSGNGQKENQGQEQQGQQEQEQQGVSHSTTSDGITAIIATDKAEYAAGEEIHYTITLQNDRKLWKVSEAKIKYDLSESLKAAPGYPLVSSFPEIASGESHLQEGVLIGDANASSTGTGGQANGATDNTAEKVTVRPYVKVMYDGQEVTVRAVIECTLGLEKQKFSAKDYQAAKRTTCHDPSIFKDFDGTYYVLGTHMTMSKSADLLNWTNMDSSYRISFTTEVKQKIRAWNKDETAGNWFDYLWAPDIIYNEAMGKYCMYLSANGDDWKSNIVLLTADKITGPYDYAGCVVYGGFDETNWTETDMDEALGYTEMPKRYKTYGVQNRRWGRMYPNCIDPCVFYDDEGNLWIAYGSWSGGIFMLELDEQTGLRDYSVSYGSEDFDQADFTADDPYFGKRIAGGCYVSGEGAYIEKIGDYYWLFISYGALEAKGGYNVRVFRSENPDGPYVDAVGSDSMFPSYVLNINQANKGIRLFGGYQWRIMSTGDAAQGHNSAFVDDDGRAYMVYHSRTTDGTEGHTVRVRQLFLNKENWLCAAPYQTNGEALDASVCTRENMTGDWELLLHTLDVDFANLGVNRPEGVTLHADGTITGYYEGTWSLEEGTSYMTITIGGKTYSGVALKQKIESLKTETFVFTGVGTENQLTLWGSKSLN